MATKIEWATESWNPISGCTPVSEGCQNCYAKRMACRLKGRFGYPEDNPFQVTFHSDKLDQPLKWKKPRMIFVCSMEDLFHENISHSDRNNIFEAMDAADWHTYLLLTKRPDTALDFDKWREESWLEYPHSPWKEHIWLGVTAENQRLADERIPILLQIPAAKHFVSIEPMLGPVDLPWLRYGLLDRGYYDILDWVICGGESGSGARSMQPDWPQSVKDQCQAADIPFFFKQWGGINKKQAGRLLNGQEWSEYPI